MNQITKNLKIFFCRIVRFLHLSMEHFMIWDEAIVPSKDKMKEYNEFTT